MGGFFLPQFTKPHKVSQVLFVMCLITCHFIHVYGKKLEFSIFFAFSWFRIINWSIFPWGKHVVCNEVYAFVFSDLTFYEKVSSCVSSYWSINQVVDGLHWYCNLSRCRVVLAIRIIIHIYTMLIHTTVHILKVTRVSCFDARLTEKP